MNQGLNRDLSQKTLQFRKQLIETLHYVQTGHPGGSLSCTELLSVLYLVKMNIRPDNLNTPDQDRFVLSKGHAAPMLYILLSEMGFFPPEEMRTLRQISSRLQGHPSAQKTPGVDASTGSLGLGLGVALGMALAKKAKQEPGWVYVLLGDGELDEGAVWENAMSAAKYNPGNLIALVDHNGVQLDGTNEQIMPLGSIRQKFEAFGWHVLICDGHDMDEISNAIDRAKLIREKPVLIEALTVKGKGISFMEGKSEWHGKVIGDTEFALAMEELSRR